jgi:ectoine hydroxylase-related dioxygenase (phytanoyl-CoA dioxygenase family)
MWLPLHDVDPEMGDVEFAIGTHRGPIGDAAISDEGDAFYERYLALTDLPRRSTGPMRAGDASFHLGWTLHRANPNRTDRDREVMTVIWFADGARVAEPSNTGQQLDRLVWLRNLDPGELAASDLNPLVGVG